GLWISNGSDQSGGQYRTDAGGCLEPQAHLVGSVPGPDQPVELQDMLLDALQLIPECRKTRTSYVRNSLVVRIGDDTEQFLDTVTTDRRNDPELGKMERMKYRPVLLEVEREQRWLHQKPRSKRLQIGFLESPELN